MQVEIKFWCDLCKEFINGELTEGGKVICPIHNVSVGRFIVGIPPRR